MWLLLPPVHCLSDPVVLGICECLHDKIIETDQVEGAVCVGPALHGR